ncbi:MAG: DUF1090 domain-containing protein [Neisseriaceae bacterium]|nr:DUF1090 domain-containing protein [Neisseriaceae bacterium]MBP6863451.1 DUF1090 domain-containing protein [Neisseriaceae bacterium]
MKSITALTLGLAVLASSGAAMAAGPCANKVKALETELDYAKTYGNRHRVAGVERALANVRAHCNDGNVVRDQQLKADKKRLEIRELELEIKQAQDEGRSSKANKKRRKLDEKKSELQQVINETAGVK